MPLTFLAFGGVVLWFGAAIVMGYALIGTTRPPNPAAPSSQFMRRLWSGNARSSKARQFHRLTLIGGLGLGILAWLVTGLPVVGILVMLAIPGAPWLFQVGRAERQAIARIEAVGEWSRRLKDVSVIGMGLQQAIVASAGTAPAQIVDEVRDLSVRLQAGVESHEALTLFADDIADPVCDQVVAALILHLTDRGDRLGDVLTSIATASSAEVATRREVDAKRTQSRFAVKFLTITTVLTIAFGVARPSYFAPYKTALGEVVMTAISTIFVVILLWVRSMSQPESTPRFLDTSTSSVEAA